MDNKIPLVCIAVPLNSSSQKILIEVLDRLLLINLEALGSYLKEFYVQISNCFMIKSAELDSKSCDSPALVSYFNSEIVPQPQSCGWEESHRGREN
jgi:hypothetical protein